MCGQDFAAEPSCAVLALINFSSDYHSPAPTILQRLPFSSDYQSPATTILQRLPFSSDCHSPATTNLQRLPFSSNYQSPATTILQRLPFSSATPAITPPFLDHCLRVFLLCLFLLWNPVESHGGSSLSLSCRGCVSAVNAFMAETPSSNPLSSPLRPTQFSVLSEVNGCTGIMDEVSRRLDLSFCVYIYFDE
jgi:hypothetical protein